MAFTKQELKSAIKQANESLDTTIKTLKCSLEDSNSAILDSLQTITDVLTQLLQESDFEIKSLAPICFYDELTGVYYSLVICQKYEDNVLTEQNEIWLSPDGIIPEKPINAIPCRENIEECSIENLNTFSDWSVLNN